MSRKKVQEPKIVRTPTRAFGGITDDERAKMGDLTQVWIKRAFRTDPIKREKIVPAIEGLYAAAGLKKPRVVIASSPLVMAFAYGAAAAIWFPRKQFTVATDAATLDATDVATDVATFAATRAATLDATRDATDVGGEGACLSGSVNACFEIAGQFGLSCAARWTEVYQGGNMWVAYESYLAAARDILGLRLPSYEKYAFWEQAAIEGGFRVMHEEFCIVSDFPEVLRVDAQNRPHCENGPSHRWRDGWSLYHWRGVKVPAHWIEDRENLDPAEVIKCKNVEQRAAGAEIVGWPKMLAVLGAKTIDDSGSPDIGELIEMTLPGLDQPGRFLKARCPRNGIIVEGVPYVSDIDGKAIDTALAAQAYLDGESQADYQHPARRT